MACGRLAPTPSGPLHLGNAAAFAAAWLSARASGARLILRMEDVDFQRSDPAIAASLERDLGWLGLDWDEEVPPQSARRYEPFLDALVPHTYRCVCSRAQVRAAGGVYPGTCREARQADGALRFRLPQGRLWVIDRCWGGRGVDPADFGDPVLQRRDGVATYNLAVVCDDVFDGVTEVVRGADLLDYTGVQVRLWEALGATPPTWLHSPLVLGPDGRKLSKSHGGLEVAALRERGWHPRDVWRAVLPWLGLEGHDDLGRATSAFAADRVLRGPLRIVEPGCPSPREGVSWVPEDP